MVDLICYFWNVTLCSLCLTARRQLCSTLAVLRDPLPLLFQHSQHHLRFSTTEVSSHRGLWICCRMWSDCTSSSTFDTAHVLLLLDLIAVQGLHNATYNLQSVPNAMSSRNPGLGGGPSSGAHQPAGSLPSGRFGSNNLPVGLSQVHAPMPVHTELKIFYM